MPLDTARPRRHRRPGARLRGVVAALPCVLALVLPLALSACSSSTDQQPSPAPTVRTPAALTPGELGPAGTRACTGLLRDLRGPVGDQPPGDLPASVTGDAAERSLAWGSPPIVLTCGVAEPQGLSPVSQCEVVRGVGWYVPTSQVEDQTVDVWAVAISYGPRVLLQVPATYRPDGVSAALADVSTAVKANLERGRGCL